MSLTGEPTELWVNAKNKQGVVFKTIWNCTDIPRFQKEEPELAKQITTALTSWLAQDKANVEKLKDWNEGFKINVGEYEYKVIQNKDGSNKLSRRTLSSGGGKGGYSSRPFTLLRTIEVKSGRIEQVQEIINNQQDSDNWDIQYLTTDEQGDKFLVLNKKPYTPPAATAATSTAATSSDSNEKGTEETTTEEGL